VSTARIRTAAGLALGTIVLSLAAACADAPTAPASAELQPGAAPAYARSGAPGVRVGALTRTVPLAQDITVEGMVTPGGGTITIAKAGLKVSFPKGAVRRPTRFYATALAGSIVAYDFGPSTVFDKPVEVTQTLHGTALHKVRDPLALVGAYFTDGSKLNDAAGKAFVTEFARTTVDTRGSAVRMEVPHFSGWMVSTGRYEFD
jgi:hypothetical protein